MNLSILIGRAGGDGVLSYTPNGVAVLEFYIAVKRIVKAGNPEQTDWFKVKMFGKMAENVGNRIKKGDLYGVQGRAQTDSYTDKQGIKRNTYEIIADKIEFLSPKTQQASQMQPQMQAQMQPQMPDNFEQLGFTQMPDGLPY